MADSLLPIYPRFTAERVRAAFADTPVVLVVGPRQSGKTTMARQFMDEGRVYFTLDDETVLTAARSDPSGFLRGLDRAVIDEVQHAPELLRAIKRAVDEDRRPGRFLLTGSANLLMLPRVSESLAGRMEIVELLPLSRSEIQGRAPTFLTQAFKGHVASALDFVTGDDLVDLVLRGGYPEMLRRPLAARRQVWARDYVRAIIDRDVRDVAEVERLDQMPHLLRALTLYAGQMINITQLGGRIHLDDKTTRRYVGILERLFLVRRLEPWFRNHLTRLLKTPKLHFLDSGLLAALSETTADQLREDRTPLGALMETFVFSELAKQLTWLDASCAMYHYRDKDGAEVDVVLERQDGTIVGIEVKTAATVTESDFRGLRRLAEACGRAFKLGMVLYDGTQTIPFDKHLFAVPLSSLWV